MAAVQQDTNLASAHDAVNVNLGGDTTYTTTRRIKATTAGVVKVDMLSGRTGVTIPIGDYGSEDVQVTKIYSTANGTTCTGVVVLF